MKITINVDKHISSTDHGEYFDNILSKSLDLNSIDEVDLLLDSLNYVLSKYQDSISYIRSKNESL